MNQESILKIAAMSDNKQFTTATTPQTTNNEQSEDPLDKPPTLSDSPVIYGH
jgi:hypothetical protein